MSTKTAKPTAPKYDSTFLLIPDATPRSYFTALESDLECDSIQQLIENYSSIASNYDEQDEMLVVEIRVVGKIVRPVPEFTKF
jgi:hypothetical protein